MTRTVVAGICWALLQTVTQLGPTDAVHQTTSESDRLVLAASWNDQIGPLQATRRNSLAKTATPVTFRVSIAAPTLNQTRVFLARCDSRGQPIAILGKMAEIARNERGRKMFESTITLEQAESGRVYFTVFAAFVGNTPNAVGRPIFFDFDPIILPPDPGELGRVTDAGVDADNDGIRDDVQRTVALLFVDDAGKRAAALNLARQELRIFGPLSTTDYDAAVADAALAADCVFFTLGPEVAVRTERLIRSLITDTETRTRAFLSTLRLSRRLPNDDGMSLPGASSCK